MINNDGNISEFTPVTDLSNDPGDETQRRFRYQHTFTALIAINMYAGRLPYKELYCEHHEDILAVAEDGTYHGIQIKTKQLKDGTFELNDAAIKGSLLRFVDHSKKFPGAFSRFVIISNCPCRDDSTGKSLINLLKQVKNGTKENFSPRELSNYIQLMATEKDVEVEFILEVLQKTEFMNGPGLNDIDSKVIDEHLGKLPECHGTGIEKLRIIHRRLCEKMHQASSKLLENAVEDYVALAGGIPSIVAEEINSKRITKQMIEKLVTENINSNLFLSSRTDFSDIPQAQSSQLMRYKMASGLIDVEDIEMVDDLRVDAEEFFIGNSYKVSDRSTYLKEFNQIKRIVTNESREAKSRLKKENTAYGTEMLHEIEDRLRDITRHRPNDVFECPYEILKGLVGILTNDCKISFSKEPLGGWSENVNVSN